MPEPISESDLLALIEGTLAPERAAEVVGALRADPAMRARAERMAADRAMLARLPDEVPAPSRTVELAMRRAADHLPDDRRAPAHRRTAMLAAAGIGIAVLAGVLALIVNATHPALRAQRLANAPAHPVREYRPVTGEPEVIGPVAEEEIIQETPTTAAQDIERRFAELEQQPDADPLLESFLARIEPAPDADAGTGPASMPPDEIAALLRSGTLGVRIIVAPAAPAGAIEHADGGGAPPRTDAPRALPTSLLVDLPEGASDAEVLRAINAALDAIRARSGVRVEFVHAPTSGGEAPLATDPRAVLWWSAPPQSWRTKRTHEVPILVTPEPASSADPPPPASG